MMKKIYIVLFSLLYLAIAVISCIHAYEFFGLANEKLMAAVLSGAFEIGQAAVLFALLTSNKERGKIMPWVLMVIFTLVQIMGNIYACYKYIMLHSQELLSYFKDPIFIWTDLPDAQATVIVTYIVAAILPICGLLLTSMVTNFLDKDEGAKKTEQKIEENRSEEIDEKQLVENKEESNDEEIEVLKDDSSEEPKQDIELSEPSEEIEDLFSGPIPQNRITETPKTSHFINI